MKVALFTTPCELSGDIGAYTRALLPALRERLDLTLFGAAEMATGAIDDLPLLASSAFDPKRYDRLLYQLGNERSHAFMLPLLAAHGGIVVQHDWTLFDLACAAFPALERGGVRGHIVALREGGVGALCAYAENRRRASAELSEARFALALNRSVVRRADGFIVHSRWMRDQILAERRAMTPIAVVPHGASCDWDLRSRSDARRALALAAPWQDSFLLVSIGPLQEHKRIEPLLRALAEARRSRPKLRLILAGPIACTRLDFPALIAELKLTTAILCLEQVTAECLQACLQAADLCVDLRGPSTGRTSAVIYRALSLGRAVLASAHAEQNELPEGCVRRIPNTVPEEVAQLAQTLVRLHDNPLELALLEQGARRYVQAECAWQLVAQHYARALGAFPEHRGVRKSLIQSAVRAADARRRELADHVEEE